MHIVKPAKTNFQKEAFRIQYYFILKASWFPKALGVNLSMWG